MKKLIIIVLFLFSLSFSIECFTGNEYVSIPEQSLPSLGYTKRNITRSTFDCKHAYKRYLALNTFVESNVKEPVVHKPKQSTDYSFFFPVFIIGIVFVVIIAKIVSNDTPPESTIRYDFSRRTTTVKETNDFYEKFPDIQPTKQKPYIRPASIPDVYNENLNKVEQSKINSGFYQTIPHKKQKTAYELLLETEDWKRCREKVFAAKGRRCEWCDTIQNLHIHHKYYLKYPNGTKVKPWQYNIDAFLVLCESCHKKAHQKYKIKCYFTNY